MKEYCIIADVIDRYGQGHRQSIIVQATSRERARDVAMEELTRNYRIVYAIRKIVFLG